ncbi:MAG TPA: protein-disulfide reductase DsbD domain-containing protein [Acidobacteriaceae bacterium]
MKSSKREAGSRKQGLWRCAAIVVCGLAAVASAQIQLGGLGRAAEAKRQHVELLTDAIEVDAGKRQDVELRFRVEPGFHINSHTPKDELLIPTVLKIDAGAVREIHEIYPKGSAFRLPVGAGEMLDVYQNEFRIGLEVVAPRGASTMEGVLRFQACDNAACYPARELPVKIAIRGR